MKINQDNIGQVATVLYEYLHEKHIGKQNGADREFVQARFAITARELRKLTAHINESGSFERLCSTEHLLYLCDTKSECQKAIRTSYRQAISLIKKARAMEKKVGLQGQMHIDGNEITVTYGNENI